MRTRAAPPSAWRPDPGTKLEQLCHQRPRHGTRGSERESDHRTLRRRRPPPAALAAQDALLLCVIVYTCVMTPVRIAFDPDGRSVGPYGLFWFEIVLDFCFLLDVLVTLNTAVEISDRWVTDRPRIARRYMQGWLAVDVVAAIPVDFILYMSIDQNGSLAALMASVTALRLLRLVRLIKITRMVKAHSIFKKIEEVSTMNQGLIHVVQMILSIAFLAHVVAWSARARPSARAA